MHCPVSGTFPSVRPHRTSSLSQLHVLHYASSTPLARPLLHDVTLTRRPLAVSLTSLPATREGVCCAQVFAVGGMVAAAGRDALSNERWHRTDTPVTIESDDFGALPSQPGLPSEDAPPTRPHEVSDVQPRRTIRTEPFARREGRWGRLWLTGAAVACLLGTVYGPLVLVGMNQLTPQEAEDLILRLWAVVSTLLPACMAFYFIGMTRDRPPDPRV